MNKIPLTGRGFGWLLLVALTGPVAQAQTPPPANPVTAVSTNAAEEQAWRVVVKATTAPMTPASWGTNQPSKDEVAKFYLPFVTKGVEAAHDFYTRYPNSSHAMNALVKEHDLLLAANRQIGLTNFSARLAAVEKQMINDPKADPAVKAGIRLNEMQRLASRLPGSLPEFEKGVRAFRKDYPQRPEGWQLLVFLMDSSPQSAPAIAKEILDGAAPENLKEMVRGKLRGMDSIGKPVNIQFTAVDGREVNIAKMRGKVVLVDFWATWCGPCMAELPHVKEAYAKLHSQGFEIVGISFDQDKAALDKTLKEKGMTWPQFFDGKNWQNKYAVEYGIHSIPTMWLVDKKGNLSSMDARNGLEAKVARLLAEK